MEIFTLSDLLDARAESHGDKVAVSHNGETRTYRQVQDAVGRFAQALAERGTRAGDRVVVLLPNSIDALVCLFAVVRLGAAAVIVNDRLKPRQVGHIVGHCDARAVVTNRRLGALLEHPEAAAAVVIDVAQVSMDGVPPAVTTNWARPVVGRDLAALIYTSGSTGRPKGVMVTHANLLAGARIVATYLELTPADRTLSLLPWSFDAGLNQVLATFWAAGTVIIGSTAHAPQICRELAAERITGVAGVPPLWEMLTRRPSTFLDQQLPDLRYATNTGGALRSETLERIRRAHPGTDFYLMYGLTEAFRSTYLPPERTGAPASAIGRAIPDTEILVLDEAGQRCAPGEVGELVHRGPTVAAGYWRDPEATARVFRPYPFAPQGAVPEYVVHSGDYVHADEEGWLTYVGRRDEQFKSRGFRVNPTEIETVLLASTLVTEAVVFADASDTGETVVAAAVVPAGTPEFRLTRLEAYCAKELPDHQQPTRIHVLTTLPRTPSGKVDRARVKQDWTRTEDAGGVVTARAGDHRAAG
ncbi:AMP-binding protein [Streptomyces sp. AGS-58]|uniref:AMP-binding protein n=1 Tax=unclassified Streptomyces TaxID=2593676 RepID=UPI0035A380B7